MLDNKNLKVTFFNFSKVKNGEVFFEHVRNFIAFQISLEGKEWADTPYKQLVFQEVKNAVVGDEDSSVLMLVQALSVSTSSHVLGNFRRALLQLLYNYGRV